MNLYDLHPDPQTLKGFEHRFNVPDILIDEIRKGKRLPDLESYIAKNPRAAYVYALRVINGRWPQGEPTIAKNPEYAVCYAYYVIHGRWRKAEPVIKTSSFWTRQYEFYFKEEL